MSQGSGSDAAVEPAVPSGATADQLEAELAAQEQSVRQVDPALYAELVTETTHAAQAAQQDPQDAVAIEEQLLETAVAQVEAVDPQLGERMAAEAAALEAQLGQPADQSQPPPPAAPSTAALAGEEQQLADRDPALMATIAAQEQQAQQLEAADPSQAAAIQAQLEQQVIVEVEQVDPQLAQDLAAEIEHQQLLATETMTTGQYEQELLREQELEQQQQQQVNQFAQTLDPSAGTTGGVAAS